MTEEEAKEFLERNNGGDYDQHSGPYNSVGYRIWKIWAFTDEWWTRFVVEDLNGRRTYYPDFQHLSEIIERQHLKVRTSLEADVRKLTEEKAALERKDESDRFKAKVGAAVFLMLAGALAYVVVKLDFSKVLSSVLFVVSGILSGAGAYFFGRRIKTRPQI